MRTLQYIFVEDTTRLFFKGIGLVLTAYNPSSNSPPLLTPSPRCPPTPALDYLINQTLRRRFVPWHGITHGPSKTPANSWTNQDSAPNSCQLLDQLQFQPPAHSCHPTKSSAESLWWEMNVLDRAFQLQLALPKPHQQLSMLCLIYCNF